MGLFGDRGTARGDRRSLRHDSVWVSLAVPGVVWLALLFVVPFYAMLAIACGRLNLVLDIPAPVWNPLHWSGSAFVSVWHDLTGSGAFIGPIAVRTLIYVVCASLLSLFIGYPVAYFVTRFAGRRKGFMLALLIAPFWISFMMRLLAWIGLLSSDGYVNKALQFFHIVGQPVGWLNGDSVTIVLGLVYGYIPYLILVLYAGLDRIDPNLIEAGRDLGLGRVRTFLRVTLPLSRQSIRTGLLITSLPMIGDFFTNQMLSSSSSTSMLGNVIDGQLLAPSLQAEGAALSLILLAVLLVPMIWYVVATNRATAEAT